MFLGWLQGDALALVHEAWGEEELGEFAPKCLNGKQLAMSIQREPSARNPRISYPVPGLGDEALTVREWQVWLVAALAALDGAPLTTAQIGRAGGISADYAHESLIGIPSRLGAIVRDEDQRHRYRLPAALLKALATQRVTLTSALADTEQRLRAKHQAVSSGRKAVAQLALEQAARALCTDDAARARRVVLEGQLSVGRIVALAPPRERELVRARAAAFFVDLWMQTDEPQRAVLLARRILRDLKRLPAEYAAEIFANAAAAERMLGLHRLPHAVELYSAGIAYVEQAGLDAHTKRRLLRWLNASRARLLTQLEDFEQADRSVGNAVERLDDHDADGVGDTRLTAARLALMHGHVERAGQFVSVARQVAIGGRRWIQGWVARYEADVLMGTLPRDGVRLDAATREACLLRCVEAWRLCGGIGFQTQLIMARVAVSQAGPDEEAVVRQVAASELAQMYRVVAMWHRARYGVRPSECGVCREEPLSIKARHGLGLERAEDWRFLT